ncbi:MAG: hypothetical protein IJZ89_08985 [Clostridia bacterium]|nr:hypothetical protein [Clostridia bacterium]
MKSTEEMLASLRARRKEYLKEKERKKRLAVRILAPMICLCILAAGFFALNPHILNPEISNDTGLGTEEPIVTGFFEVYNPGNYEDSAPIYSEIIHPKYYYDLCESNMMIVEWGEAVRQIEISSLPDCNEAFVGIAVKYVNIFESTMVKSFIEGSAERFGCLENGEELNKRYDDIILIPESYLGDIEDGDISLISLNRFARALRGDFADAKYYYVNYGLYREGNYHYQIFPIEDGKLEVPENMYDKIYGNYASLIMEDLMRANETLRRKYESCPNFESGITLEEIENYFDIATDPDTFPY